MSSSSSDGALGGAGDAPPASLSRRIDAEDVPAVAGAEGRASAAPLTGGVGHAAMAVPDAPSSSVAGGGQGSSHKRRQDAAFSEGDAEAPSAAAPSDGGAGVEHAEEADPKRPRVDAGGEAAAPASAPPPASSEGSAREAGVAAGGGMHGAPPPQANTAHGAIPSWAAALQAQLVASCAASDAQREALLAQLGLLATQVTAQGAQLASLSAQQAAQSVQQVAQGAQLASLVTQQAAQSVQQVAQGAQLMAIEGSVAGLATIADLLRAPPAVPPRPLTLLGAYDPRLSPLEAVLGAGGGELARPILRYLWQQSDARVLSAVSHACLEAVAEAARVRKFVLVRDYRRGRVPMLEAVLGVVGSDVLSYLSQTQALPLRIASKACCEAVAEHAWDRAKGYRWDSCIRGSVAAWRRCFPHATFADMHRNTTVTDADFVQLRGIHTLDMSYCTGITDAGMVHLRGIHTLNMCYCTGITDAGMEHLRGIHKLLMYYCPQISAAALVQLEGAVIHGRPPVELDEGENPDVAEEGEDEAGGEGDLEIGGGDDANESDGVEGDTTDA